MLPVHRMHRQHLAGWGTLRRPNPPDLPSPHPREPKEDTGKQCSQQAAAQQASEGTQEVASRQASPIGLLEGARSSGCMCCNELLLQHAEVLRRNLWLHLWLHMAVRAGPS